MHCGCVAGDLVDVRGARWRVRSVVPQSLCHQLTLDAEDPVALPRQRVLFAPFDRPRVVPKTDELEIVSRRKWCRRFLDLLVTSVPQEHLTALPRAHIDLLPYQVEPALAMIRGRVSRALIADAVGSGKTIQAGLVLAELAARGRLLHALIVTPAGLRDQWAGELRNRFGLEPVIVDSAWLRRSAQEWPAAVNPWEVPPVVVTSLDFVKRPENLGALSTITWDLVVLDEAHAASNSSDRARAASELGRHARLVILLTATPHSGDTRAFFDLCRIGSLFPADPIAVFRRARPAASPDRRRRVHLLRVGPTEAERKMHGVLERYAARAWSVAAQAHPGTSRLGITVLLKRAASSAFALARSVAFRRALLSGAPAIEPVQLPLPIEDEEPADEAPRDGLDVPALPDPEEERDWLDRLGESASAVHAFESKLRALGRLVRRVREPAIVFTEFRDTLNHVASFLAPLASCAMLHGGLAPAARRSALQQFDAGSARVLLATDAGGEGLNLQAHCRLVVNFELPWNPMRLEQRIGRVDRIGQSRRVHAVNFVASGTFESALFARLAARVQQARSALGSIESPLGSSELALGPTDDVLVADAVMQGTPLPAGRAPDELAREANEVPIVSAHLEREAAAEVERAAAWRSFERALLAGRSRHRRSPGTTLGRTTLVTVLQRRRLLRQFARAVPCDPSVPSVARSAGVVCLFVARVVDRYGRTIESSLIPVSADGLIRDARPRALARPVLTDLLVGHGDSFRARAQEAAQRRLETLNAAAPDASSASRMREIALADSVRHSYSRLGLLQPGLFDLRAERHAAGVKAMVEALQRSSAARLAELDASACVSLAADPELALVLLISG